MALATPWRVGAISGALYVYVRAGFGAGGRGRCLARSAICRMRFARSSVEFMGAVSGLVLAASVAAMAARRYRAGGARSPTSSCTGRFPIPGKP